MRLEHGPTLCGGVPGVSITNHNHRSFAGEPVRDVFVNLTYKNPTQMMLRGCLVALTKTRMATRAFATLPDEIIVFPDDETVVCWHPEKQFPYECSKPLPVQEKLPYSPLKIQDKDARLMFARKPHERELAMELAKLTYTTKHRWFPRARDKKAKKTKPDRPYL